MADSTEQPFFLASYTPEGGLVISRQLSEAVAEKAMSSLDAYPTGLLNPPEILLSSGIRTAPDDDGRGWSVVGAEAGVTPTFIGGHHTAGFKGSALNTIEGERFGVAPDTSDASGISQTSRLTTLDRIQALQWAVAHASPLGARIEIHDGSRDDLPEIDYIGIYRAYEPWLVWRAVRTGEIVTVWHGPSGSDLGSFKSMKDALAAIDADSVRPRLLPNIPASTEQRDDDYDPSLALALNSLESAIMDLVQKSQEVTDAAENRGKRIDAVLAKIDAAMAALTNA